jgi:ubiquinol-cytochrome c reductase cytochrome b subunit
VGTYLSFFVFGGQFPGEHFIPRLYIVHVLLVPGLLLALITAHLMIVWHQGHTQWPGVRERDRNEVGVPLFPVFMAKTGALFFFVFASLAALGAAAQINPVWLFGPYSPVSSSSNSQPDWYIGFLIGALRLMPGWETNFLGHTIAWDVFIPGVLLPASFFLLMGGYPMFERWVTGDARYHQVLDRPRNMPARTALGAAILAMATDLQLAGSSDVIALHLNIPLYPVVCTFRAGFFVLPVATFGVTRRVCVSLQRTDRRRLRRGTEFGIAAQRQGTAYTAVSQPVPAEQHAVLETRRPDGLYTPVPRHLIPLPTPRRALAQVRARLNHLYVVSRLETPSAGPVPGALGRPELDGQAAAGGQQRTAPTGQNQITATDHAHTDLPNSPQAARLRTSGLPHPETRLPGSAVLQRFLGTTNIPRVADTRPYGGDPPMLPDLTVPASLTGLPQCRSACRGRVS